MTEVLASYSGPAGSRQVAVRVERADSLIFSRRTEREIKPHEVVTVDGKTMSVWKLLPAAYYEVRAMGEGKLRPLRVFSLVVTPTGGEKLAETNDIPKWLVDDLTRRIRAEFTGEAPAAAVGGCGA